MTARINEALIRRAVRSFPDRGEWKEFKCQAVLTRTSKATWKPLDGLDSVGGVYVILLPSSKFPRPCTIHLHAARRKKIRFEFTVKRALPNGYGVVYIGRTSKLKQRFRAHLSLGNRIASAQVKHGLVDCGLFSNQKKALSYLRRKGLIMYHELPGEKNCANRDVIEVSLCSSFKPPFNIKAER